MLPTNTVYSHVQEFKSVSDLDENLFENLYSAMLFVIHDT